MLALVTLVSLVAVYPTYRGIREQKQAFIDITAADASMVGIGEGELTRRAFAFQIGAN